MAETVRSLRVEIKITGSIYAADNVKQDVLIDYDKTFSDGTGDTQLGTWFLDSSRSLDTTSEDLDLNGTLPQFNYGATVDLNNVKVLVMENLTATTGDDLILKQGAANPATTILGGTGPTLTIGPSGICVLVNPLDGYGLTAGSADTVAVQAIDTQTYKTLIAGDNA